VRHTIIRLIGAHLRREATVSWQGLNFDFTGVVFDGGDFRGAEFADGTVTFESARFSGGEVDFGRAEFSGGEVDFGRAEFSGGTVDFSRARHWPHPPMFSWDGEPPTGVMLPVQPPGEPQGKL